MTRDIFLDDLDPAAPISDEHREDMRRVSDAMRQIVDGLDNAQTYGDLQKVDQLMSKLEESLPPRT